MAAVRIPADFRARHEHEPRPRHYCGTSHAYGRECTIPVFRYPWRCSCGAEGREGGRGGHRVHVEAAYEEAVARGG